MQQPISNARGRLRPGSSTSPAVKVTLFHADCENNGPVIDLPTTSQNPNTPAATAAGCAAARLQPFCTGFHQSEMKAAAAEFQPTSSPSNTRSNRASVFVNVKL